MTEPVRNPGLAFISYPGVLRPAIAALDDLLREAGVPTFLDQRDFTAGPAARSLRSVIEDETTSQGVVVVTRDTAAAQFVLMVEAPALLDRARNDPTFSLVIAKDAGLTVDDAAKALGSLGPRGAMSHWHMVSFNLEWESPFAEVVQAVLCERVKQIARGKSKLAPGSPRSASSRRRVVLGLYTMTPPPRTVNGEALVIDWSQVYDGSAAAWTGRLLPAALRVSTAVRQYLSTDDYNLVVRPVGPASAACVVLGAHFLAQWGPPVSVEQRAYGERRAALWSLAAKVKESGFHCIAEEGDLGSRDIALMLSITAGARPAFLRSHGHKSFRAYLEVKHRTTPPLTWIGSAGEAAHVVRVIAQAVRDARHTYGQFDVLHLFLAAPASILFLIGQSLTYVGAVQVYDYVPSDATGAYEPGPLLRMESLRTAG